jgi:Kef-type K+ transport system membrane component KefB
LTKLLKVVASIFVIFIFIFFTSMFRSIYRFFVLGFALSMPFVVFASSGSVVVPATLLGIAVVLLVARFSSLVEKVGQPSVLGELIAGIALGNMSLLGITLFDPIKTNEIILFLSELGVIVLLFQIGLESNISRMAKVGFPALRVAVVGVIVPFVLGTYVVGPLVLPGLTFHAYLFLGAALTATSVGITARVFKDLGSLQTRESQIVLGAAVIDDVLGLIILAVVSAMVTVGEVTFMSVSVITLKALLFLVIAVFLGQLLAPKIGLLFSKIHSGSGMKFTLAFSFALLFAYIASQIGLAPIVGAFAAGLVLDAVCFRTFRQPEVVEDIENALEGADDRVKARVCGVLQKHSAHHVEHLIEPMAHFVVPIFFVMTGMSVHLESLFDTKILLTAIAVTVVAVIGKMVSGLVVGRGTNKMIVGLGMIPRGEVGLIFATMGVSLGVVSQALFSVIVLMVVFTTLLTPPLLALAIKKLQR